MASRLNLPDQNMEGRYFGSTTAGGQWDLALFGTVLQNKFFQNSWRIHAFVSVGRHCFPVPPGCGGS